MQLQPLEESQMLSEASRIQADAACSAFWRCAELLLAISQ